MSKLIRITLACVSMWTLQARAFSLLGPYEDWMTTGWFGPDLSYHLSGNIGGPMDLEAEYRWNVPVVTYGFDQTFVDFFGSDGVKAVESAIKVLNQLPPASKITLTNFPTDSRRYNSRATALGMYDLKSAALSLLLEQMGLDHPTENVFNLRRWDPAFFSLFPAEYLWMNIPNHSDYVLERNFDPETRQPSHSVNGILYTGNVTSNSVNVGPSLIWTRADIVESPVDPWEFGRSAVADAPLEAGLFYTGLTRDDVGGLRYLLQKENVNYEPLLPSVQIQGQWGNWMQILARVAFDGRDQNTNAGPVLSAFRSGVEKITFVRHPAKGKPRRWLPLKYQFTDRYLDVDGIPQTRRAKRTVEEPDILFCAGDRDPNGVPSPWLVRTDTSKWINGSSSNAGPGIICPQIRITFPRLEPLIVSGDSIAMEMNFQWWGSFDGSTNPPAVHLQPYTGFSVRLRLFESTFTSFYDYPFGGSVPMEVANYVLRTNIPIGRFAALQTSTDQTNWVTVCSVLDNRTPEWEWRYYGHVVIPGEVGGGPLGPGGVPNLELIPIVFFRVVSEELPSGPPSGPLSLEEQRILIEVERERARHNLEPVVLPPYNPENP